MLNTPRASLTSHSNNYQSRASRMYAWTLARKQRADYQTRPRTRPENTPDVGQFLQGYPARSNARALLSHPMLALPAHMVIFLAAHIERSADALA